MRTFIQLRDGIGYATLSTPAGEPDHSVTPDHTTAIEVFTDNADQFIGKQYNAETKSWSDAEVLFWAEIAHNGAIMQINKTVFQHEVNGPLLTPEVESHWKWVDGEWVAPKTADEVLAAQQVAQAEADALALANAPTETPNES
jgi:hypothetical protein